MFRTYKRTINKLKLSSRTVRLVHREAEVSLLATQMLLAHADLALRPGARRPRASRRSARGKVLIEIRRETERRRRSDGSELPPASRGLPSGGTRNQRSPKATRVWPRRKPHKPPKPPILHTLNEDQKVLLNNTWVPHDDRSVTDVGWHPSWIVIRPSKSVLAR